jgi:hypothetical protein
MWTAEWGYLYGWFQGNITNLDVEVTHPQPDAGAMELHLVQDSH